MGGNARHAAKGPDKRSSTCDECSTDFTHGKFSHPTYCPSCRDARQDPDDITTNVTIDVDTDTRTVTVTVTITNENDVPYRDIPLEREADSGTSIIGFVRVEGTEFAAETAWVEDLTYNQLKLRAEDSKTRSFTWDDGAFAQDTVSLKPYSEDAATDFIDRITMTRGDPFDEDKLEAEFIPAETSPELNTAHGEGTVPSFLIDL